MDFGGDFEKIFDVSRWTGEELIAVNTLGLGGIGWAGIPVYALRNPPALAVSLTVLISGVATGQFMLGLSNAGFASVFEAVPYLIQAGMGRKR